MTHYQVTLHVNSETLMVVRFVSSSRSYDSLGSCKPGTMTQHFVSTSIPAAISSHLLPGIDMIDGFELFQLHWSLADRVLSWKIGNDRTSNSYASNLLLRSSPAPLCSNEPCKPVSCCGNKEKQHTFRCEACSRCDETVIAAVPGSNQILAPGKEKRRKMRSLSHIKTTYRIIVLSDQWRRAERRL